MRRGKVLPLILSALLCVTAGIPAFAGAESRMLLHASDTDGSEITWIECVCPTEGGFSAVCQGAGTRILRYTDPGKEPEVFLLEENTEEYVPGEYTGGTEPDRETGEDGEEEDGEAISFLTVGGSDETDSGRDDPSGELQGFMAGRGLNGWFSRNNELYALQVEELYSETDSRISSIRPVRIKTEDGKAIPEDAGLPALDTGYLVEETGSSSYYNGMGKLFTAGDRLIGIPYGEYGKVLIFDLTDGSCLDITTGSNPDIAPGPDGSVLVTCCAEKAGGITNIISRVDPVSGRQETLAEIPGAEDVLSAPCYDPEKDTLYYVSGGQLWKMPQFDPEKAEALCEYSETESSAMLLADGSILLWNNKTAAKKDTEPDRSERITLRVQDVTYNSALNEAIYEMGTLRSDVSVSLEQDARNPNDILNALLVRDGSTDIYVTFYDMGDFKAARDRGYLADAGKYGGLAENIGRMYPFAQEAAKRDGKIIAVPLGITGDAVNFNMYAWKRLGGTEEELPRTWDRFFDWLETLPDRLAGTDVAVTSGYTDRSTVRAQMIAALMEMYQIRMERTGKDYLFNTPELRALLKRACEVDYGALGIPETVDDSGYEVREALLDFSNGIRGVRRCDESAPMGLAFAEGEEPLVPVSLFAAFMNPYTEHPEEAGEFLGLLLKHLDANAQYSLFADKTEPVREPLAGDPAEWAARLERLQGLRETAEGDDRVLLEEEIREAEKALEETERSQWRISPAEIGQYQKSQAAFRVMDSYFLRELVGTGEDQEAMEAFRLLFYGNGNGEIDPEKALEIIDKKLRMKRMEGN